MRRSVIQAGEVVRKMAEDDGTNEIVKQFSPQVAEYSIMRSCLHIAVPLHLGRAKNNGGHFSR